VKLGILMLALLLFLTSCASAPPAPPPKPVPCPVPPRLDPLPPDVLEKSFIGQMENFLQGRLPEQTKQESSSSSAESNTKP